MQSIHDTDRYGLSMRVDAPASAYETQTADLTHIVDRIGADDAFAAILLRADVQRLSPEIVASCGLVLRALTHRVHGDMAELDQRHLDRFSLTGRDLNR